MKLRAASIRFILIIGLVTGTAVAAWSLPITLTPDQMEFIAAEELSGALVTDPDIAEVQTIEGGLRLIALKPGKTFLHVWDKLGRRTYAINVEAIIPVPPTLPTEQGVGPVVRPITYTVKTQGGTGTSTSAFEKNRYNWNYGLVQLGAEGDTAWGGLSSYVQFEEHTGIFGFSRELTGLNISLVSPETTFIFGNNFMNWSELTLPYVSYQGILLARRFSPSFQATVIRGARGDSIWGRGVKGDFRFNEYFTGVRATGVLHEQLSATGTLLWLDPTTQRQAVTVTALELIGRPTLTSRLEGEFASTGAGTAIVTKGSMAMGPTTLSAIVRNVSPQYRTITDTINWQGVQGYFLSVRSVPLEGFSLSGNYNNYGTELTPNRGFINNEYSATVDISPMRTGPKFSATAWRRDLRGIQSDGVHEGATYQLAYDLALPLPGQIFSTYLRAQPSRYQSGVTPTSSYSLDRTAIGVRYAPTPRLTVDFDRGFDSNLQTQVAGATPQSGQSNRFAITYGGTIGRLPLEALAHFQLQSFDGKGLELQKVRNSYNLQLIYRPTSHLSFQLDGALHDTNGPAALQIDSRQSEVHASMTYRFQGARIFTPRGNVEGQVYHDGNSNGAWDEGEPVIAGAAVHAGDQTTTTDAQGRYKFSLPVQITDVRLEIPAEYSSLIVSDANPRRVIIRGGETATAAFGLTSNTRIQGLVFEDRNGNRQWESDEPRLPNVRVRLTDGTTATTDGSGTFRFSNVAPGRTEVSVDMTSLPIEINHVALSSQPFMIREGETTIVSFPAERLRAVYGRIFVDKNGNGRFDGPDQPMAKVRVTLGTREQVTDVEGRYIFRNVPLGTYSLTPVLGASSKRLAQTTSISLTAEGPSMTEVNLRISSR